MRGILHFVTPFYPRKSGLGNYVMGLCKNLPKDYEISVVCCDTENTKQYFEVYNNIKIYRVKTISFFNRLYFLPNPLHLVETLKNVSKNDYFLVHTHTRFFMTSLVGLVFAKIKNIPVAHIEHGSSFVQNNNRLVWLLSRIYDFSLGRLVLSKSDYIFCVSRNVSEFVKKLGKRSDVFILPNGVDTKRFRKIGNTKKIKTELNLNKSGVFISYIGRLIEGKGVQDLIKAVEPIDGICLIIAGDGPYRGNLEKISQINGRIVFLGEIDTDKVIKLLSITEIFVNPSHTEGMPTSILEAGSVGCACIATNVGGTSEIIESGKNSFLIEKEDILTLREKINLLLLNKRMRKNFSIRLKSKIRDCFEWKRITDKYLAYLEGIQ